jgi:glycosyltransferase involved in cell wall biosynthesis
MKISIIIPCYDEKATIEKIVEAVRAGPIQSKEIIIVDDGSRDGTQATLNEISNTIEAAFVVHAVRLKKF